MRIDYRDVPESQRFAPLPEGEYLAMIEKVEERQTKSGFPLWALWLKVLTGAGEGRMLFDSIVFSDNLQAQGRAKFILHRLGFPVDTIFEVESEDLVNKRVFVTVETEEYEGKERSKVTFDGYRAVPGVAEIVKACREAPEQLEGVSDTDDVPF